MMPRHQIVSSFGNEKEGSLSEVYLTPGNCSQDLEPPRTGCRVNSGSGNPPPHEQ